MFPVPNLGWLLLGALMRKFARRQRQPDSTTYLVGDPEGESGLGVVEVSPIPESVIGAEDFLHWIGRR